MVKVTGEDVPNIPFHNVGKVVIVLKKHKAPGCDGTEAELCQCLVENGIKAIWQLCSMIWQNCK